MLQYSATMVPFDQVIDFQYRVQLRASNEFAVWGPRQFCLLFAVSINMVDEIIISNRGFSGRWQQHQLISHLLVLLL